MNSQTYPHTAPVASKTSESFTFDPPASPKSASSIDKNKSQFKFDASGNYCTTVTDRNRQMLVNSSNSNSNKTNHIENLINKFNNVNSGTRKEDICRVHKTSNKDNDFRREKRSFKCDRLSNIFKESPTTINKDKETKHRKINSAPVYRKHSMSQNNPKLFNFDDESSSPPQTAIRKSDLTMFPFDREAIDYDRIRRECFAVEEEYDSGYLDRTGFPYDYQPEESPSYEYMANPPPVVDTGCGKSTPCDVFKQYTILSQQEKERQKKQKRRSGTISPSTHNSEMFSLSKFDKKSPTSNKLLSSSIAQSNRYSESALITNTTPTLPDLRIDFFAEPNATSSSYLDENENDLELDRCQQSTSSISNNASGNNINVTSNPMDQPVCNQPRATIVVQQVC